MIGTILTLIVAAVILILLWYFLKNVTTLIVNSIVGLVVLLLVSHFGLFGMTNFSVRWIDVLICALGGLPGALIIIVLNFFGISI